MIVTDEREEALVVPKVHMTARQVTARLRALIRSHNLHSDSDMTWARDPENPPTCQGVLMVDNGLDSMFFPAERTGGGQSNIVTTTLCSRCPVRDACHDFGVKNDYVGVWGGEIITYSDVENRKRERRSKRRREAERAAIGTQADQATG